VPIFIRFNPDKYTNANGITQTPSMDYRLDRIKNDENEELLEITYLFYDEI